MSTLPHWLAASYLPSVGPRTMMRWLETINIDALFKASRDELLAANIPEKYHALLKTPAWAQVEKDLAWQDSSSYHHIICYDDERYPALLKEIIDPPLLLYVSGDATLLSNQQIAMVGSRHATAYGLKNAEQFAHCLASAGITITSGLALGIDAAAHAGALAAKGKTLGVMGTGLQRIYPSSHKKLAQQMIEGHGAIVSEFPLAAAPIAANFPRRNRVIAGLSIGVLVIEAAVKSGSLITARFALEQGREVFAIPGSIHQPQSRGCHYLLRQGAKLVEGAEDILEELGGLQMPALDRVTEVPPSDLSPEFCHLLDQIQYTVTPIDMIIWRSGLTAGAVSSMLLTLELQGRVQSVAGGYIRTA